MTTATYMYLTACLVMLIVASVALGFMCNAHKDLRKADRKVSKLASELNDMEFSNKLLSEELMEYRDKARAKKSATNTDYLIEEEEYA